MTVNGTQENRVGLPPENDNIFRFVDAVLKSFEDIKVPRMEKNICLNHGMTSRLTKHNIAFFFVFFYSFTVLQQRFGAFVRLTITEVYKVIDLKKEH